MGGSIGVFNCVVLYWGGGTKSETPLFAKSAKKCAKKIDEISSGKIDGVFNQVDFVAWSPSMFHYFVFMKGYLVSLTSEQDLRLGYP